TFPFTLTVTDALFATASRQFTVVIAVGLTVTTPPTLPTALVGVPYQYLLQASGGTSPYTWSNPAGSLPAGLSVTTNGNITGIPSAAGPFTFTVQVKDSAGNLASAQLSITVAPALSVTTGVLPVGMLGAAYSQSLAATGGTPPYTWSLLSGALPGGLTLSAGGAISGTAGAAGTFPFTVKVTDSAAFIATKQLSVTIAAVLSITSAAALPSASINVAYSQNVSASGGTPPYSWALSGGALPGGLTLSSGGAITGTPSATGTFQFTLTVTDSVSATASQQFTLIVSGGLTISTAALPGGKVGASYSQTLTAAGGVSPYTFSVSAGTLPPGITLNGAVLGGTPTKTGSYPFTIQVTDSTQATASAQFTIVIGGLAITTSAVPAAAVGTAYSYVLSASETAPYAWTITQGTLPDGLTLDKSSGTISGTPTAAGSSNVTVQVADSTKSTASATFTLTVISASFTGLSGTADSAQQVSGTLALGAAYPQDITGQVTLAFVPESSLASPADDPSIQFTTGGNTASFTIPANSTAPVSFAFQTGTVAGTITLTVSWQADGAALAVPAALTQAIQIAPAVPVITAVTATTTSSGFQVVITGYSNTREATQANLQFTPASGQTLQTTSLTVSLTTATSNWFPESVSYPYGGQFTLTLPFSVSDGTASAIGSISVQLVNTQGTSTASSATL
ncbi:MAG: putative Ig domain-containing protein, partial [Bryobacteraceae bacterium]